MVSLYHEWHIISWLHAISAACQAGRLPLSYSGLRPSEGIVSHVWACPDCNSEGTLPADSQDLLKAERAASSSGLHERSWARPLEDGFCQAAAAQGCQAGAKASGASCARIVRLLHVHGLLLLGVALVPPWLLVASRRPLVIPPLQPMTWIRHGMLRKAAHNLQRGMGVHGPGLFALDHLGV